MIFITKILAGVSLEYLQNTRLFFFQTVCYNDQLLPSFQFSFVSIFQFISRHLFTSQIVHHHQQQLFLSRELGGLQRRNILVAVAVYHQPSSCLDHTDDISTFANKTGRNTQAISTISESGCGRQQVCHLHLPLLLNPHSGLLVYAVNIGQTQFLGSHFHHLEVNQISDMTSHFIIIFVLFLFSIRSPDLI